MKYYTDFRASEYRFEIKGNKSKKGPYCNNVFTLDTESSSTFIKNGKAISEIRGISQDDLRSYIKQGVMYIWMMSVNGVVYYGRYGSELRKFLGTLKDALKGARFYVYVQNLSWDYAYLINDMVMEDVFARSARTPLKATSPEYNCVFRDAYCLNMMSLEMVAQTYNLAHAKQTGSLDYSKLRLPCTPLTEGELKYCEYDCLVLHDYITMKMAQCGNDITKIAMTQTGEIRLLLKEEIKNAAQKPQWGLVDWYKCNAKNAPDMPTMKMLVAAYSGGYTHANARLANIILKDVLSNDLTSDYPSVIFLEKFPIGRFYSIATPIEEIDTEQYAYLITVRFSNIKSQLQNTFISKSHCDAHTLMGCIEDNGRVWKAKSLTTTITEQDWLTIKDAYRWDSVEVLAMKRCRKGRIPRPLINLVVKLYKKKSYLKAMKKAAEVKATMTGDPEDYRKYRIISADLDYAKSQLNGVYGMCVTKVIAPPVTFGEYGDEDAWDEISYLNEAERAAKAAGNLSQAEEDAITEARMLEQLDKHNERDLLPYQWGVWVSAIARRNLSRLIIACDSQVAYCDTDSIKTIGDVSAQVEAYNEEVRAKRHEACKFYGVDDADVEYLGEFDQDGDYSKFVTLGAKKYAVVKRVKDKETGEIHEKKEITISGVNKGKGVTLIADDLSNFRTGLLFDEDHSGRKIRYYNDNQQPIMMTDYLGNSEMINQKHGIILQPTTYMLGRDSDATAHYTKFCEGAKKFENVYDFVEEWVDN